MTSLPTLRDVIAPELDILFVGINPSVLSAQTGHHFARKTNRFYRALYESGLTIRLFSPEEDGDLPGIGIGITNIVARPTGMAQELGRREFVDGRAPLCDKVRLYRPMIVAFAGRMAATGFYGKPKSIGIQDDLLEGARVFVAPSPSAANKAHHPDANLYAWYTRLREFRDSVKRERKGRTPDGDIGW